MNKVMYSISIVSFLSAVSLLVISLSSERLTTVKQSQRSPSSGLNFCLSTLLLPNSTNRKKAYFCDGTAYENFTKRLWQYALSSKTTTWGRREYPVPAHNNVLMIGNSHTRQVYNSIRCQYARRIDRTEEYPDVFGLKKNIPSAWHFDNNSTMVVLSNSPYVYNRDHWTQTMEMVLRRPMDAFDAVVMGRFNGFETRSNFGKELLNFSVAHPEYFDSSYTQPTIDRFASVYRGPIVAVTMFAAYGQDVKESAVKAQVQRNMSGSGTDIIVIDARKHIEAMGDECGSDSLSEVGLCLNTVEDNNGGRDPKDMHRCIGKNGGHPDLVAWDVVEGLHQLLTTQNKND